MFRSLPLFANFMTSNFCLQWALFFGTSFEFFLGLKVGHLATVSAVADL
jgi:hypothetical protein